MRSIIITIAVLWSLAATATAEPLKHRWFYLMTNLQVNENVPLAGALLRRAAKAGYNGVVLADYKLNVLDAIIVNWNSAKPGESLPFFAGRGHRQVLAGYYDGSAESIRNWLRAGEGVRGIEGAMYTTWQHRFDDLEAFAHFAWPD